MLQSLSEFLSTRELSFLIWLAISLALFSFSKSFRAGIFQVLRAFFVKRILIAIGCLLTYVAMLVYLLNSAHLWNTSILKDTVLWTLVEAVVLAFNAGKAQNRKYFVDILRHTITWTIALDFFMNFFTFSLPVELILLPIVIFVTLLYAVAERDLKAKQVHQLLGWILNIGALLVLGISFYHAITKAASLFTFNTLLSLMHPVVMTVMFLPFAYLLAMYMQFETLFVRIPRQLDAQTKSTIKLNIILSAKLNIDKLNAIAKNFNPHRYIKNEHASGRPIGTGKITTRVDGANVDQVWLWTSPDGSGYSVCHLADGSDVDILNHNDEYYLVRAKNDQMCEGYCLKGFVSGFIPTR